jgi:uridylate kinase
METPKYKRVLLKLSGEALAGDMRRGMDFNVVKSVAAAIRECTELGVQVGIVVGGGNYWRGVKDGGGKMERTRADQMGMLATTINALGILEALEQEGMKAAVMTGVEMPRIAELFTRSGAVRRLENGEVDSFPSFLRRSL